VYISIFVSLQVNDLLFIIHHHLLKVNNILLVKSNNLINFPVNYKSKGGGNMQTEFAEKYITLGLKIAYYRKKAGYTQEYFAELIDKSVNFVGQVEGPGTVRGISLETLFKIAQVLKIPPSKLLEDD
jgi:DNA-binding XRE family transcriptional regulator